MPWGRGFNFLFNFLEMLLTLAEIPVKLGKDNTKEKEEAVRFSPYHEQVGRVINKVQIVCLSFGGCAKSVFFVYRIKKDGGVRL